MQYTYHQNIQAEYSIFFAVYVTVKIGVTYHLPKCGLPPLCYHIIQSTLFHLTLQSALPVEEKLHPGRCKGWWWVKVSMSWW